MDTEKKKIAATLDLAEGSSALIINPDFSLEIHLAKGTDENEIVGQSTMYAAVIAALISHGDADFHELIARKAPEYLEVVEDGNG